VTTTVTHLVPPHRPAVPAALGPGRVVRGRALAVRLLVIGLTAALAAAALGLKVVGRGGGDALPPLPGAARVTPHLIRGGQPADYDLLQLRDAYRVRAVVNFRLGGDAEGDIAAGFGIDYLGLATPAEEAPGVADLTWLVAFVQRHETAGGVVYMHDDVGGGRVISAALMLLMLRGEPLGAALTTLTPAQQRLVTSRQWSAVAALSQALTEHVDPAANPYAGVVALRW
jgi:hypothetical protein